MADAPQDEDFGKELAAAFAEDEGIVENPVSPAVAADTPTTPPAPAKAEDPIDDPAKPADKEEEATPPTPADPAQPPVEDPAEPEAPEAPTEPEATQPLTEEGIRRIMSEMRTEERNSGQELESTTQSVMESYYPEGLSNVLVDQSTGKELRTPQDVVDATGGEMAIEDAARWLMNEQYTLDRNIEGIKKQAQTIAETTVNFRHDSMAALQKYEPLFKQYPQLQSKAFDLMMKQVKVDNEKDVVLVAPDIMDLYDTYLEPYQKAYEFGNQQAATSTPATPPPAKPGINDRLDEGGDGGANVEVNDPNDFAQQVTKELAKGLI